MENSPASLGAALAKLKSSSSESTQLRIQFTGSGSEYFRIWIVNLLLIIVTFGLYFPWAKVRRLRYFYGNTVVDGEALGFHGDPKKMFKGFVLVGLLFGLYSMAGNFSPTAGFVALLIVVAIWPALFKSSMQFRMANTSWRGLRFRFCGTLRGAYGAMVPLFVPGVLLVGLQALEPDTADTPAALGIAAGMVLLASMVVLPWLLWNLKKYQHNNYALATLQTSFKASPASFYLVCFKTLGVGLLAVLLSACIAVVCVLVAGFGFNVDSMSNNTGSMMVAGFVGSIAGLVAMFVLIKPFAVSRIQNLVWTQTGNTSVRFVSTLTFRSLLWLTVKNWILVMLTLGLYWPFAAVAVTRLRVEAVSVKTRISIDTLVSHFKATEGEAAGDAAGDFFGIDIGL